MGRKYRKKLGSRTYHGDKKNRRGKGIRGGRGGTKDHKKFSSVYGKEPRLKPRPKEALTMRKLVKMIEKGEVEKEGDVYVVDLRKMGYYKLVGRAALDKKVRVIGRVTERAREAVMGAGGEVVEP